MQQPIIVGVDGSEQSLRAADWAASEAALHRLPVRLVNVSMALVRDGWLTDEGRLRLEGEREAMLDRVRARMLGREPALEISKGLLADEPGRALLQQAGGAPLVVAGARGIGGFDGLVLGSVCLHLAGRAPCPVMIVPATAPDPDHAPAEIVVGVDEARPADRCLDWAYREAELRDARLTALHAVGGVFGAPAQRVGEDLELSEALAGRASRFPDVRVTRTVVERRAGAALVEASERAALVVVGAHRRRGVLGLGLGRTNHAVVHHARCPVVIAPEGD